MTDRLALPRRYRDQLEALLREHVPGVEVWAYGSRVNGESHDGSDLDLALRGPALEPLDGGFNDLLEAIEKSTIPIMVQAHDWAKLPESFHREIERDYVVVQEEMGTHTRAREWREVTLAEAPIAIIDGDRGNNYPKQHEFLESGHCLFLNAGNVTSDGFNFSSCAFVSSDRDERLRKGKLNRHDVVLTTRETVGNSAYFDATIPYEHVRINSGMVILRALQPALHPRYLYILTQSQLFLSQVQALRTGSAQPQLPIRDIVRITIPLPPLPEQRSIAHILGTLDDKIELNRRMNRTLEEMARAIFQDWFVDFGPTKAKMEGLDPYLPPELWSLFPDKLVDSELGEIPEGWDVKSMGDCISLERGLSYKGAGLASKGMPMHNLNSVHEGGGYKDYGIKFYKGEFKDRHVTRPDDVIVSNTEQGHDRLLIGFAAIVPKRFGNHGLFSHHIYRVRPNSSSGLTPDFICHLLNTRGMHETVSGYATGTTVNMLPTDALKLPLAVVPSECVITMFSRFSETARTRQETLIQESQTLTELRQNMIPKLVSGEVMVR